MSYNTEGTIHHIGELKKVTEKFSKLDFAIVTDDTYQQTISFQLINQLTNIVNSVKVGDRVKVYFNIAGKPWKNQAGEEKYFLSLNAFKMTLLESAADTPAKPSQGEQEPPEDYFNDDLSTKVDITRKENSVSDDLPF